jgi:hypothetical protein
VEFMSPTGGGGWLVSDYRTPGRPGMMGRGVQRMIDVRSVSDIMLKALTVLYSCEGGENLLVFNLRESRFPLFGGGCSSCGLHVPYLCMVV